MMTVSRQEFCLVKLSSRNNCDTLNSLRTEENRYPAESAGLTDAIFERKKEMDYRRKDNMIIARIDRGEEVMTAIKAICEKENIRCGMINGLGAADHVAMGAYDVDERKFHGTVIDRAVEVTNLTGNVTTMNGEVYLHIHITVADKTGAAFGGHLNECRISGTSELFIQEIGLNVGRKKDEKETGLNLFDFSD